jgi:PAS domain S-box-containing protein
MWPVAKQQSRSSFRIKLMVAILSLIGVCVGAVLVVMERVIGGELRATLAKSVENGASGLDERYHADLSRLAHETVVSANESRLISLFTQGVDARTLSDSLHDMRPATGWDLAAFVGTDGSVMGADGQSGALQRIDLSSLVVDKSKGDKDTASGYLKIDGAVYRVASTPVEVDDRTLALLVAGEKLDDKRVAEEGRMSGTQVLLIADGAEVATSHPSSKLVAQANAFLGADGEVEVGGEQLITRKVKLGPGIVAVVVRSSASALAPYNRARGIVYLIGLLAFLSAVVVTILMSRNLARPVDTLQQLASASVERAERTQEDMQRLMDAMPSAISVEVEGRFLYANQAMAKMLGRGGGDELVGGNIRDVVAPEDREKLDKVLSEPREAVVEGSETEIRFLQGTKPVETEVAALPVEFAGIPAILTVAHDLTLRKQLQARVLADKLTAKELEVARTIQQSLVPSQDTLDRRSLKLAGHFEPTAECGGDWWTWHDLKNDKILLVIGDVTGHGIPSAMMTAAAKAACDVFRMINGNEIEAPALLEVMNEAIYNAARERFAMTCFAAIFDTKARSITFANAAHNFPLLCRGVQRDVSSLTVRGNRLGDAPRASYEAMTMPLEAGDTIIFYTDGIVEAQGADGEQYGVRRFREQIKKTAHLEPPVVRDMLIDSYHHYLGRMPRTDDVTLVVAKVY